MAAPSVVLDGAVPFERYARALLDTSDSRAQRLWHRALLGCGRDAHGLVAYARLLPGGTKHTAPSIGRVITVARARGTGLGKALMREAVERLQHHVGAVPIVLGAQAHLQRFYAEFGFVTVGAEYLEDGIPHIDMQRG